MDGARPRSRRPGALPPVQLGSEFDLTFEMAGDSAATPVGSSRQFGASTFSATLPASSRLHPNPLQEGGPLAGANEPEVYHIGIVSRRPDQAPGAMARLSPQNLSERANTARSSVPTQRPMVKPKMYVFAYREEAEYIPRPFISSHRPKVRRERAASARTRDSWRVAVTGERPAWLSKRREVMDADFCHSMVIGSFQQFERRYRGP
jgi:hypothetical protein